MIESPILDLVLAFGLLVTAYRALHTRVLFTAVVFYIAFGMLMSIVWVRLRAPDLALTEAALGAGVMGAILLDAARALEGGADPGAPEPRRRIGRTVATIACVTFAVILSVTLLGLGPGRIEGVRVGAILGAGSMADRRPAAAGETDRARGPEATEPAQTADPGAAGTMVGPATDPGTPPDLAALVEANLPASGVTYPVTAVLLNFRGYDTMLEVMVLFLAALGSLVVFRGGRIPTGAERAEAASGSGKVSPVAVGTARLLAPWGVLVGGYLLWLGSSEPGGAFQAGAVVGAAGVMLVLSGEVRRFWPGGQWTRATLAAGSVAFLVAGTAGLATTGSFFRYPPRHAGLAILLVETAVAVGVAVTLVLLYAGGRMKWPELHASPTDHRASSPRPRERRGEADSGPDAGQ